MAKSPPVQVRRAKTPAIDKPVGVQMPSPAIPNYPAAVKYLYDRVDVERLNPGRLASDVLKLDRMHALLGALDNPHESIRSVHVAGTKGKGSTCEMTASCLEACGYTVGIYTSPHLVDVRERIRIDRKMISHTDFTRVTNEVAAAGAKIKRHHGEPTFFELMTAMCFLYFAEEAVDIAIIECGLGGRLDSTNVLMPEVTAITSISLDHMQILGDTVEKIAREKAGIFKPNVPAITVPQSPGVLEVFREVAARVGAPLEVLGQDLEFSMRFEAGAGKTRLARPQSRVCLTTPRCNFEHLAVPLKGEHQAYNCGLALAIIDRLSERGFNTPESKVTIGLDRTECPGRMELAWQSPRILLDGAHNPESIKCLMKAIGATVSYDSMVVIFGCAADKDTNGMLEQIDLGADKVIFTRAAGNPRAANPEALAKRFTELKSRMCQVAATLPEAVNLANRAVGRDDLVCITGSFYLVGEAKKYLKELTQRRES
jgi:dihydrofolate synthase / folylpolyglutamate synthase